MSHLKKLLIQHGINQTDLAHILKRDKSVVTNLFQGKRQLKATEAALIASHIGVPVAEVMGLREETGQELAESPNLIPFKSTPTVKRKSVHIVKKGKQYYLDNSDTSWSPKRFALEITDDSMNLSGILPGDIVVAEMDRSCKPKQLLVVQHYQGRGATTLVRRYQPPFLISHSTSGQFPPLHEEEDDVRLVAPVLKLIRTF